MTYDFVPCPGLTPLQGADEFLQEAAGVLDVGRVDLVVAVLGGVVPGVVLVLQRHRGDAGVLEGLVVGV